MREFMAITKALSDKNRVRILMALHGGELCVCQIIELLGLAPSTVSKHMSILSQTRLVESRKDGRWRYYRLPGPRAPRKVKEAVAWVRNAVSATGEICKDAKRLEQILRLDQDELCRMQRAK